MTKKELEALGYEFRVTKKHSVLSYKLGQVRVRGFDRVQPREMAGGFVVMDELITSAPPQVLMKIPRPLHYDRLRRKFWTVLPAPPEHEARLIEEANVHLAKQRILES